MQFPFLVTLDTKHYKYRYHIKNKTQYQKVGLEILTFMYNDLKWIEEPQEELPLEKALEKAFDVPYSVIKEAAESSFNKHIKLIGEKVSYYESGYDTPRGANVLEQIENIKRNRAFARERRQYIKLAKEKIEKGDKKNVWDIVQYFAGDAYDRISYDNDR